MKPSPLIMARIGYAVKNNIYIPSLPLLYTDISYNKNDTTRMMHIKRDVLHSVTDNPALIDFIHDRANEYDTNITGMSWYYEGKRYRHLSPLSPAEIGFYADGNLWYECFYNEHGNIHSHDNLPALIRYHYSRGSEKIANIKIWAKDGVAIRMEDYDIDGEMVREHTE